MPSTTCRAPRRPPRVDRLVEHRHQSVDAFDREALDAHVRAAEEPLERRPPAVRRREQRRLLVVAERRRCARPTRSSCGTSCRSFSSLDVLELVAEARRSSSVAQLRARRPPRCRALIAERRRRDVVRDRPPRSRGTPASARPRRAAAMPSGSMRHGEVAVPPDRGTSAAAPAVLRRTPRRTSPPPRRGVRRAAQLLGEPEKLAPGLVDRRRVATIGARSARRCSRR